MVAVILCLICVLLVLFVGYLAIYWKPSRLPGPRGLPYFGIAFSMIGITSKDIIHHLMKWFEEYGDIFEFQILGQKYVFVTDPQLLQPILSSNTNITKGRFEYSFFRPMFNDGLIISDGDKWRTRRKLLTPSFHFKILETSIESVGRNTEEFVSHLLKSNGKATEIEDHIYLLTFKIICETAMGVKLNTVDNQQNEYIKASKICHDSTVYRYLRIWLFPDFIYRLCKVAKNTFLDNLLELDDSNPGLFTKSDIREEVDTFMIAGHNPTAAALKFLHFLLANHPDVQEKVHDEQVEIYGDDKRTPTAQDLHKMIYLEMVIKETLRLYPSIPLYSRLLDKDLQIDEKTIIPAGCNVAVFNYCVHRSKKHWDNPEEFVPERFVPGIERHPYSFIPFSAGPRNCIGQKYAMMELKTIMSTLVRQCWLEPVSTSMTLDYGITLSSTEPIIVKVFPRNETQKLVSNE
ncbi:unnamed protein product [Nezara viridula]|uniref:Cytochrome P450 n=1 Tax=Nezara viridula TaxID=85310 RepID=A0A9P0HE47_NEZVI|nr:unnamed protein product [Nezara viridula]